MGSGTKWKDNLVGGRDRLHQAQRHLLQAAVAAAARQEKKPIESFGFED